MNAAAFSVLGRDGSVTRQSLTIFLERRDRRLCVQCQSLAACIPTLHERERLMGMLHGYFDESGKADQPVVAFCGFLTAASKMQAFDDTWNHILRVYQMDYFTAKDAFRENIPMGKFSKHSVAKRIEVLKPFADCIRKHFECGVSAAVQVEGFSALSPGARKQLGRMSKPHFLAFLQSVVGCIKHVRDHDRISFICDDDEETAWDCYQYYRRARKILPLAQKHFVSIAFADDKHFPALQAADLLSSLVRMHARLRFLGTGYDYEPLFEYLTKPLDQFNWGVGFHDKAALAAWDLKLAARG
jgi:Protein of unknown function (DUF3800)